MSMKKSEIIEWLNSLEGNPDVGIDEDGFNLTLADELYETESLEIGMALSSTFIDSFEKGRPK